jgi:hypothetical protein
VQGSSGTLSRTNDLRPLETPTIFPYRTLPMLGYWRILSTGARHGSSHRGPSRTEHATRRCPSRAGHRQTLVLLERTNHGTWELIPAAVMPRDQAWLRHPEMAARVAEGESDLREGRSSETSTPEALHTLLDGMKRD